MINRTMQLGRLAELRQQLKAVKIEIDSAVKNMLFHFEPLDQDLGYIAKIDVDRLKILTAMIDRKKKVYDRLKAEIEKLEIETGESNGS